MFHYEKSVKLTMDQERAMAPDGVASPPFNVRHQRKINAQLENNALPKGFTQVPLFNHNEHHSLADDLDMDGCDYVDKVDSTRFPAETTYSQVEFLKDDLRAPFTVAFNLT